MSTPLNTSSDDAAIFQANSNGPQPGTDDGGDASEDPTGGKSLQRAPMFRIPPTRPRAHRITLPANHVPGPTPLVRLTPGALDV